MFTASVHLSPQTEPILPDYSLVEGEVSQSLIMKLQGLIGGGRQIQVKPDHSTVVRTNYDIVSTAVHGQRGNPFAATHQLFH